jgi:sec-independent protein translocase protein TatA
MLAFFGGIGTPELLLFGVILVLLFGANRLPSLMRNLGRSATEFKQGMRDDVDDASDVPKSVEKKENETFQP